MLAHKNSDTAHAIRAARRETIRAASVLPPYGERFGDWLNSLSRRELYIYYTRMARAKGVRTGDRSVYVAQFGRRP